MQDKSLPEKFLTNMKSTFEHLHREDEYLRFIDSFSGDYVRGIRMNSLKVKSADEFADLFAKMNRELNGESSLETICVSDFTIESMSNSFDSKTADNQDAKKANNIDAKSTNNLDAKSVNNRNIEPDTDFNRDCSADNDAENQISTNPERVPWSTDGFYISNDIFPGRHPFYKAGIFYLQEPSAMVVAYVLDARPGDMVLDICAAPGGKSVKIAADMQGEGVLFSNDINEDRVKALLKNIELAGCPNCIVLNETPQNLSDKLEGVFDKILVDAPCSGEGMFRKDPNATKSWEKFGPDSCMVMQRDILQQVDKMLKPGGVLVYSTCTFNTCENEQMIEWFLDNNSDYVVERIEQYDFLKKNAGIDGAFSHSPKLDGAIRILPHMAKGEGHFCVKLRKRVLSDRNFNNSNEGDTNYTADNVNEKKTTAATENKYMSESANTYVKSDRNTKQMRFAKSKANKPGQGNADEFSNGEFLSTFHEFANDLLTDGCIQKLNENFKEYLKIYNGHVYTLPKQIPSLDGLKVPKKGLYIGKLKRLRDACVFEPSHSFALSMDYTYFKRILTFSSDDAVIAKYLKCETISFDGDFIDKNKELLNYDGYIAVAVDKFLLGWGKIMKGGMMKNLYPSGWVN